MKEPHQYCASGMESLKKEIAASRKLTATREEGSVFVTSSPHVFNVLQNPTQPGKRL
jgi:hypothetical protein